nr:M67 family metallopeptidase [Cyanobium sp. FACHB-13342]
MGQMLASAGPREGCALLLGQRLGDVWRLDWVWPCCNVWPVPDERCRHFAIDPREQLLAQKWGRQRGLELLGSAHSHPTSEAVPSAHDRRLSALPALMVILGGGSQDQVPAQARPLLGWWIPEPPARPQRLPWTMES